jgi:cytochrome c oxidase assembly protein subunit 11
MNRNTRVALICVVVFFSMVGAAFAAVPLYRVFCQATGFAGTVRRAGAAPTKVLGRTVSIRFDTNVRGLPWDFHPDQLQQDVAIGATGLAYFKVTNHGTTPLTGRAVYNVAPEQAGAYFEKLECFCFTNQTLQPGETKEFPVAYFVDPAFATGDDTRTLKEITLSYTFYPATDPRASSAPQPKTPAASSTPASKAK